jgi:hypothetical protein
MLMATDITPTATTVIEIHFLTEVAVIKNIISDSSYCDYRYNQL